MPAEPETIISKLTFKLADDTQVTYFISLSKSYLSFEVSHDKEMLRLVMRTSWSLLCGWETSYHMEQFDTNNGAMG